MSEGIDDILNGVPETDIAPEPTIIEQPPEDNAEPPKAEQPRGPDGKFAPKGENDAPPASEEERVPVTAIQDERRKRQDLERQLAELRQQLSPPQPAPDMYDDPDAWQQHFGNQVAQTATSQAALNARLDMSEMLAAQAHQDFEDVRPKILEFMEANPAVRDQILSDRHPWNKAYQLVKNHEKMTALGATDVSELEARIRTEVTEQIKAEMAKPQAAEIPQTLATAQGGTGSVPPSAPPSLQDLLGR